MEMNAAAAAQIAGVTVATIRTWCRRNVIAAEKRGGRWIIDADSLAHRLTLGGAAPQIITRWGACGHTTAKTAMITGRITERHDTCPACASANARATAQQARRERDNTRAARRTYRMSRRATRCECASGRYGGVCTCC